MRREKLGIKLPRYRVISLGMDSGMYVTMKFKDLIDNAVVLHSDKLNIDFVVRSVSVTDDLLTGSFVAKIEIDILDEIDKEIQKSLDTLKESLGELLLTKRPEKFAGEEW